MEHYVTLFDRLFLPQGLALYQSLERLGEKFTLWILCVDDAAFDVLSKLELTHARLLPLAIYETEALLTVKNRRTRGEYCWTLTPFAPSFVFDADSTVSRVTYVDADLWFRKSPKEIFEEFDKSGKPVLITEHAYHPFYDMSETAGKYCVQFMIFVRGLSEPVLKSWEKECIEWCYNRYEEGRFGDQKYLEKWPEKFGGLIHVLKNKELTLAPWNMARFPYGCAVFFHFHGLRIYAKSRVSIGYHPTPRVVLKKIYSPYREDLKESMAKLSGCGYGSFSQISFIEVIRRFLIRTSLRYFW